MAEQRTTWVRTNACADLTDTLQRVGPNRQARWCWWFLCRIIDLREVA